MEAIKQFVTDLILNSDHDIDEVYAMAVKQFIAFYDEVEIQDAFDLALADLPELN